MLSLLFRVRCDICTLFFVIFLYVLCYLRVYYQWGIDVTNVITLRLVQVRKNRSPKILYHILTGSRIFSFFIVSRIRVNIFQEYISRFIPLAVFLYYHVKFEKRNTINVHNGTCGSKLWKNLQKHPLSFTKMICDQFCLLISLNEEKSSFFTKPVNSFCGIEIHH